MRRCHKTFTSTLTDKCAARHGLKASFQSCYRCRSLYCCDVKMLSEIILQHSVCCLISQIERYLNQSKISNPNTLHWYVTVSDRNTTWKSIAFDVHGTCGLFNRSFRANSENDAKKRIRCWIPGETVFVQPPKQGDSRTVQEVHWIISGANWESGVIHWWRYYPRKSVVVGREISNRDHNQCVCGFNGKIGANCRWTLCRFASHESSSFTSFEESHRLFEIDDQQDYERRDWYHSSGSGWMMWNYQIFPDVHDYVESRRCLKRSSLISGTEPICFASTGFITRRCQCGAIST